MDQHSGSVHALITGAIGSSARVESLLLNGDTFKFVEGNNSNPIHDILVAANPHNATLNAITLDHPALDASAHSLVTPVADMFVTSTDHDHQAHETTDVSAILQLNHFHFL